MYQGQADQLKDLLGDQAEYSEYKRGDRIRYRVPGDPSEFTGEVLWVIPPRAGFLMFYLTLCDGGSFPDLVIPSAILEATERAG